MPTITPAEALISFGDPVQVNLRRTEGKDVRLWGWQIAHVPGDQTTLVEVPEVSIYGHHLYVRCLAGQESDALAVQRVISGMGKAISDLHDTMRRVEALLLANTSARPPLPQTD